MPLSGIAKGAAATPYAAQQVAKRVVTLSQRHLAVRVAPHHLADGASRSAPGAQRKGQPIGQQVIIINVSPNDARDKSRNLTIIQAGSLPTQSN